MDDQEQSTETPQVERTKDDIKSALVYTTLESALNWTEATANGLKHMIEESPMADEFEMERDEIDLFLSRTLESIREKLA